jgi:hypothetical protein
MARSTKINVVLSNIFKYEFTLSNGILQEAFGLDANKKHLFTGNTVYTMLRTNMVDFVRAMGIRQTYFLIEEVKQCIDISGDELNSFDILMHITFFE